MAKRKATQELGSIFDWDLYNALAGLEAIGELVNPEAGLSGVGGHDEIRDKLCQAIHPLSQFARARLQQMADKLEDAEYAARPRRETPTHAQEGHA